MRGNIMESEQVFPILKPHSYPWYVKIFIFMPLICLLYFFLIELPILRDIKYHMQLVKSAIYNNSYEQDNDSYNYLLTHYDSRALRLCLAKTHLLMKNQESYWQALMTLQNTELQKGDWKYLTCDLSSHNIKSLEKFIEEI